MLILEANLVGKLGGATLARGRIQARLANPRLGRCGGCGAAARGLQLVARSVVVRSV
jgi:hypothetical protein